MLVDINGETPGHSRYYNTEDAGVHQGCNNRALPLLQYPICWYTSAVKHQDIAVIIVLNMLVYISGETSGYSRYYSTQYAGVHQR